MKTILFLAIAFYPGIKANADGGYTPWSWGAPSAPGQAVNVDNNQLHPCSFIPKDSTTPNQTWCTRFNYNGTVYDYRLVPDFGVTTNPYVMDPSKKPFRMYYMPIWQQRDIVTADTRYPQPVYIENNIFDIYKSVEGKKLTPESENYRQGMFKPLDKLLDTYEDMVDKLMGCVGQWNQSYPSNPIQNVEDPKLQYCYGTTGGQINGQPYTGIRDKAHLAVIRNTLLNYRHYDVFTQRRNRGNNTGTDVAKKPDGSPDHNEDPAKKGRPEDDGTKKPTMAVQFEKDFEGGKTPTKYGILEVMQGTKDSKLGTNHQSFNLLNVQCYPKGSTNAEDVVKLTYAIGYRPTEKRDRTDFFGKFVNPYEPPNASQIAKLQDSDENDLREHSEDDEQVWRQSDRSLVFPGEGRKPATVEIRYLSKSGQKVKYGFKLNRDDKTYYCGVKSTDKADGEVAIPASGTPTPPAPPAPRGSNAPIGPGLPI